MRSVGGVRSAIYPMRTARSIFLAATPPQVSSAATSSFRDPSAPPKCLPFFRRDPSAPPKRMPLFSLRPLRATKVHAAFSLRRGPHHETPRPLPFVDPSRTHFMQAFLRVDPSRRHVARWPASRRSLAAHSVTVSRLAVRLSANNPPRPAARRTPLHTKSPHARFSQMHRRRLLQARTFCEKASHEKVYITDNLS